jgi:GTPase SAR1 family protein
MSEQSIDELRETVERRYPYPLVRLLLPLDQLGIDDWRGRAQVLAQYFGDVVRFLAIVAVCDYLSAEQTDPDVDRRLNELFVKPLSYGQWVELLRICTQQGLRSGREPFMPELAARYSGGRRPQPDSIASLTERLTSLRNILAKHGSSDGKEYGEYEEFVRLLSTLLAKLDFLAAYPLISAVRNSVERGVKQHEVQLHMGDRTRPQSLQCDLDLEKDQLFLLNTQSGELLGLYPFCKLLRLPGNAVQFCQLSGLRRAQVEYDCDGEQKHDPEAAESLRALLASPGRAGLRLRASYLRYPAATGGAVNGAARASVGGARPVVPPPLPEAPTQGDESRAQAGDSQKQGGDSRKQGGDSQKQEGESRKQGGESRKQEAESRKQEAESRKQAGESRKQGSDAQIQGAESQAQAGDEGTEAPAAPVYDADETRAAFLGLLDRFFTRLAGDERARALLGDELLEHLQGKEQAIRARLATDFSLVVVGNFKRGKSSLINALLGTSLAGVDVTPETLTINEYGYGPELQAVAQLENGSRVALRPEELRAERLRLVLETLDKRGGAEAPAAAAPGARQLARALAEGCDAATLAAIAQAVELPLEGLPGTSQRERAAELVLAARRAGRSDELLAAIGRLRPALLATADGDAGESAAAIDPALRRLGRQVRRITVRAPLRWLNGLRLVDTPGTGLSRAHDAQVQAYMPRADAIVYVISARSPLSQSERAFLQNAIRPYDFAKVFFVINQLDTIRKDADARRLLEQLRARIWAIFPGAPVFGLSALGEICRQSGEEPPNPGRAAELDAAFDAFRASLNESILLNRDLIQLDRAALALEKALDELTANIEYLKGATAATQAQRQRLIAQYADQHSALHATIAARRTALGVEIDALCQQTLGWIEAFLERFAAEALPAVARHTPDEVQQHFPFFLTDSLRGAIDRCLDAQRPVVARLLSEARSAIGNEIVQAAGPSDHALVQAVGRAVFGERAWTNIDALHFVVDQGLQRMFGLSNEVMLGLIALRAGRRQGDATRQLDAYLERLREALPELREALRIELRALYDDLAAEIDGQLRAAAEHDIAASLATLRQAEELLATGRVSAGEADETFRELLLAIEELQDQLQRIRPELGA